MYNEKEQKSLIEYARSSIKYGLDHHNLIEIEKSNLSNKLIEIRACFVTLNINNSLRGCIGSLNAFRPLVNDVNVNAYAAAFEDPRFPKLRKEEYTDISIEISILSTPEEIIFNDENDLISQLRTGIDGLIFEYKQYRSTYLPSVWSSLPTARLFLTSLKEKAGVDSTFWADDVRCYRYTTEIIK